MTGWLLLLAAIAALFGLVVIRGAPYVPTKRQLLDKAFDETYPLSDKDVLIDIGSGDGVVLRAAAARGARAVGYELNPILVIVAKMLSRNDLIQVRFADFWHVMLPKDTTIIYTFGESRDIKRMYEKARRTSNHYKKELYFMSFGFAVPGQEYVKYDGSFYLYRIAPLTGAGKRKP